jgi:hypothetical protein
MFPDTCSRGHFFLFWYVELVPRVCLHISVNPIRSLLQCNFINQMILYVNLDVYSIMYVLNPIICGLFVLVFLANVNVCGIL